MPQIIERMQGAGVAPATAAKETPLQTNPIETPKTDSGAAPNPETTKSPDAQRLEAMVRKEKALRRESQRLSQEKTQQSQFSPQFEAMKRENAQLRNWAQRFYRNPVEVLNEAGVSGDLITQGLMNQPSREAVSIRALQAQIAQLTEQNKAIDTKLTEGQQAQYDQAKNQIRSDAKQLVAQDEGNFEAIKAQGQDALDAVVELIEQTFEKEDRLMSVKEAADEVENFLIEEAMKLNSLKKVQTRLGQANTLGGQNQGGSPASSQGPSTLSNRGLPAPSPKGRRTEKERVAAAIQAFQSVRTS